VLYFHFKHKRRSCCKETVRRSFLVDILSTVAQLYEKNAFVKVQKNSSEMPRFYRRHHNHHHHHHIKTYSALIIIKWPAAHYQWRNYERRGEAIASGRLVQGGALSPRIIFFCFATEFQKTEISKKSKLVDNDESK